MHFAEIDLDVIRCDGVSKLVRSKYYRMLTETDEWAIVIGEYGNESVFD